MKKERFKSIFLILLIITNLVLAEKILVNEKLWLSGYNFFVSIRNPKQKNTVSVTKRLVVPENIVVNTGYQSSRFIYLRNNENFEKIFDASCKILKEAFSLAQKDIYSVTAEDWYSVLSSKSIYLNYQCSYDPSTFSSLLGISESNFSLNGFRDILINELGNVYIKSADNYYRIATVSTEISPIIRDVAEENSNKESVINYSFDLNFDDNSGEQKTILSPMILIYSEPILSPSIIPGNPITNDNVDNKVLSGVLKAFLVNKNSARRYTEADGSLVFVENNGILKIFPDGILTFTAGDNGIKLNGSGSSASKIALFIENVNSALGIDTDIEITNIALDDNTQSFTFDYIFNGYPIKYPEQSGISVTVKNGYLTEYKQVIKNYKLSADAVYSPDFIESLDKVISRYQNSMTEMRIDKMYPAFLDDLKNDIINIDWYVAVDNIIAQ